ncbi:hypothetical protein Nepgr_022596 [Nepenthes gracilis]|uniref:Uncharacterized protein n=1 Tax=Nepenthes gracilis TaxID=150966 RepID=A0AAD3T120_NEPGR|nr:hypothetical protein Nepgr_022596 [Nepenthes gracilis]
MSGSFQFKQASYALQEGVWDPKNESHIHFPGMDKVLISPPFITSSEPSNHQWFLSDMNKMLNSCLESAGHGMVMFDGSSSVLEDGWRETQQSLQATKNLSRQQVVVNGGLKARTSWDNTQNKSGWSAESGGGDDGFIGGIQSVLKTVVESRNNVQKSSGWRAEGGNDFTGGLQSAAAPGVFGRPKKGDVRLVSSEEYESLQTLRAPAVVKTVVESRNNMPNKSGWSAESGGGYDEFTGGIQLGAAQGVPNGREFGGVPLVSFPVVRKTVEFVTLEKRNLGGGRQQVQQQEFSEAFRRHFNEVQAWQNG